MRTILINLIALGALSFSLIACEDEETQDFINTLNDNVADAPAAPIVEEDDEDSEDPVDPQDPPKKTKKYYDASGLLVEKCEVELPSGMTSMMYKVCYVPKNETIGMVMYADDLTTNTTPMSCEDPEEPGDECEVEPVVNPAPSVR